jgi:hypothetical protein
LEALPRCGQRQRFPFPSIPLDGDRGSVVSLQSKQGNRNDVNQEGGREEGGSLEAVANPQTTPAVPVTSVAIISALDTRGPVEIGMAPPEGTIRA